MESTWEGAAAPPLVRVAIGSGAGWPAVGRRPAAGDWDSSAPSSVGVSRWLTQLEPDRHAVEVELVAERVEQELARALAVHRNQPSAARWWCRVSVCVCECVRVYVRVCVCVCVPTLLMHVHVLLFRGLASQS